jgi:hypothetical protein
LSESSETMTSVNSIHVYMKSAVHASSPPQNKNNRKTTKQITSGVTTKAQKHALYSQVRDQQSNSTTSITSLQHNDDTLTTTIIGDDTAVEVIESDFGVGGVDTDVGTTSTSLPSTIPTAAEASHSQTQQQQLRRPSKPDQSTQSTTKFEKKEQNKDKKTNKRRRGSIDLMEYVEASASAEPESMPGAAAAAASWGKPHRQQEVNSLFELIHAIQDIHYFWTSDVLLQIYAIVLCVIIIRQFWVLQVISILLVWRMVRLLMEWGFFIWDAPDLKRLKSLILWWVKFGLDFASKTVEGHTVHKFVASFSYNFWSGWGKDITLGTINSITQANKERILKQAQDNLRRANESRQQIASSLRKNINSHLTESDL